MIPISEPWLGEEELNNVIECIKTNWISSQGKFVKQFENDFASFCNKKFGIATSNGTTSLHLALSAKGIKTGDEVIVPTFTFIATANVVKYCNAKPVLVDSEKETWNIDPSKIEEKITKKTKAIIPVHVFGHPADMDPIMKIAKKYGLFVLEDAAEAHGAKYKGKIVGSIGDVGSFSFFGNKIITTGEGGMLVTDDEGFLKMAQVLRDHGMSKEEKYIHPYLGFNYRMTNLQAAVGVAQLAKIGEILRRKRRIAEIYEELLKGTKGISFQPIADWANNVYWFTNIIIEDDFKMSRDELRSKLNKAGIDARPFFYPIHQQPSYKEYSKEKFPVADEISRKGINLPSSANLKEEDIEMIANIIKG